MLSFSYTFKYENDIVFFSHFYPYGYRDLKNALSNYMPPSSHYSRILRMDSLCKTLAGNQCYVLTITQNINTYLTSEDEQSLFKKSDAARSLVKRKLEIYEARNKLREVAVKNSSPNR